jgi:hypothetical protein
MAKTKAANDETVRLLKEGAKSYPDAIVALNAFRRDVYKCCREVVVGQLTSLGKSIGVTISREHDVEDYDRSDPDDVELSVRVRNAEMNEAGVEFYAGLAWWEEEAEGTVFATYAGFWIGSRRVRDRLRMAFNEASKDSADFIWEDDGVYIERKLNPDEAGSFQAALTELVGKWITLGKKRGSIMNLLKESS